MATLHAKLFVLKMGITGTPVTIANCRTTNLTINNELVDITSKDNSGYRMLLSGGGLKSYSISFEGFFDDSASQVDFFEFAIDATSNPYTIVDGAGNTFTGNFIITNATLGGAFNEGQTFNATLENDGAVTYTPHA